MQQNFSENLRCICAESGSIAQVCREIGINRQQFNRYLNGAGMPSAHNLRRIARHFGLTDADLFADPNEFVSRHIQNQKRPAGKPVELLTGPFRDQSQSLKRYLGFYHSHFQTPSWDGMIMRSLIWMFEKDGYVMTRSIERVTARDGSVKQKSRYEGLATQRGNRVYVVEHELARDGSVVETILTPSHRQQVMFLRGMTIGVAWRPHMTPYASRAIWKRIGSATSLRDALKACGAYPIDSRRIDPTIRSFLTEQTNQPENALPANILL